jgi:hypothetical protein
MNEIRRIQKAEKFRASTDFQKLLSLQEHPTSGEIGRFLMHEIARFLPRVYPDLYNAPIAGGFIHISQVDSSTDFVLTPDLFNPVADIYVQLILHELGVDTSCRTTGEIIKGERNVIPADSIRQYGKNHKNQILEWLAAGQYDNMFVNDDFIARVKKTASLNDLSPESDDDEPSESFGGPLEAPAGRDGGAS